jgi:DNA-binding SARP family transcriptional activator
VEIRVLGPVELRLGDRVVDVGPLRQRAVLAALAVDAGRPVMLPDLIDRVWDDAPPTKAHPALYAYISRLRRLPGPDVQPAGRGQATGLPIRLAHRAGGYILAVEPEQVDLHRFRRLVAEAGSPSHDEQGQADLLHRSLTLWSGVPLAELPGEWAARMRTAWQQERLDAAVRWAEAELRLGHGAGLVSQVRELLSEYPLAEPLVEALMRALIAAGRDAEAIDCYAVVRERLADQLGVDPGPNGAPYLRYRNHKMRREAMVPIDDTLAAAIQARQQQIAGQQPGATALFPRQSGNPDQRLPIPAATFNVHLQQWLADCHVIDESGAPVKVTAHQFRHTYATRLINSEVSQEVVRRLLDHTSHTMTAHYARLADATIREQWQRAQKVNIRGEPVDPPDDQAMAEAARRRREQTLTRAHHALQQLVDSGQPVTIATLAAHADVSRAWLYSETELRARIDTLRNQTVDTTATRPPADAGSEASLRNRLTLAHQRIRELTDQNQQLRDQIAHLHGQLRASKLPNSAAMDTVHNTNNLVELPVDRGDPR